MSHRETKGRRFGCLLVLGVVALAAIVGSIIAAVSSNNSDSSPEAVCATQMYDSLQTIQPGATLYYGQAIKGSLCTGLPASQLRAAWHSALKQNGISGQYVMSVTEKL